VKWELAICTQRCRGHLPVCLLAESPGVLRALIFRSLGVTKNNWKCIPVLLHLFLPDSSSSCQPLPWGCSHLSYASEPHYCHSTPLCGVRRISDASRCVKYRQFILHWHIHQNSLHATCKSS